MRLSVVFFLLFIVGSALGQNTDEELAAQYYADQEYDKAEVLYKKLLKKDESSVYIYQNYLNTLIQLKNYDEAEKMVSKQRKHFEEKPVYAVDLGYIYSLQGDEKKANKAYSEIIDNMGNSPLHVEQVASAFLKRNQTEYAISAFLAGRKKMGLSTAFAEALMDIYLVANKPKELVSEALAFLNEDPKSIEVVKRKLIRLVDTNTEIDYLQEKTTLYNQKYPENGIFDELLMWVYIQQKKFNSALRQAAALDKRTKQEGRILVELARICIQSNEYAIASECFQRVIDLGSDGYYFMNAKMGLLETSYLNVTTNPSYTEGELKTLISAYSDFQSKFGITWNTAPSLKQFSDIYIFYTHETDKGIALLEQLVAIPRLQAHLQGELKLSLGDAQLMNDNVWEAALLYGQVDKAFKEDPLGQEAKLRNAQLSYYQGDFAWAQDQLDVLKTATSQLISNNAIELSLVIQDNIGLDSSTAALQEFAQAQLLLYQNRLDECINVLNLLPFKYPGHSLEDDIYYTKARLMEKKRSFDKAEEYYLNVVNDFKKDILADNAAYRLGVLYETTLNKPKEAIEMYKKLIFEYSGSLFVVDARKRYKYLVDKYPPTTPTNP
ncbi:MAG: tetratricopeptide (TPR) repeat protein [Bacteroidia bacterium]|jgi:tetratricopeptide (TPR) repeat protein